MMGRSGMEPSIIGASVAPSSGKAAWSLPLKDLLSLVPWIPCCLQQGHLFLKKRRDTWL